MKIRGYNVAQLAEHFGVAEITIERSLRWAREEGLIKQYEQDIIQDLVPEAIKVYRDKLINEKDFFAAKDILDKLVKFGDRVFTREQKAQEKVDDLEKFLNEVREKAIDVTVIRSNEATPQEGTNPTVASALPPHHIDAPPPTESVSPPEREGDS